jgi:Protein of unknown function (DUF 659)
MLDSLYEEILASLLSSLHDLCKYHKAVLMIDGWTNVVGDHIVNVHAAINGRIFFLDSVYCGATQQSAAQQAVLVQGVLDQYQGTFNAVITDGASACRAMRAAILDGNPGVVTLNDQTHTASDIGKTPFFVSILHDAHLISRYVRNHGRLETACKSALVSCNKSLSTAVRSSKSASNYLVQCPTRFAYNRVLLEVTGRNFYALSDVLEKTPGGSRVPCQRLDSLSERLAVKFYDSCRRCVPAQAVYNRRPNYRPRRGVPAYL